MTTCWPVPGGATGTGRATAPSLAAPVPRYMLPGSQSTICGNAISSSVTRIMIAA
jgi:hypothetical protein